METFILIVMYFVTPPAPGPKVEKDSVWTLQTTTQTIFEDLDFCRETGKQIIRAVEPVQTLTVRAYCLCPQGDGQKKCDNVRAFVKGRVTLEPIGK